MPISQVRFTGISHNPKALKRSLPVAQNAAPVAFTGVNYNQAARTAIKKMNFPGIWQGIKDLFAAIGRMLAKMKPHTDKANKVLDQKLGKLWERIRPIST